MTETQTQTPAETTDPWADVTVIEPQTAKKPVDVPESLLTLARQIRDAKSRDVVIDGWSADKLKDFTRYMKGAADKLGTRFRTQTMTNGGRQVLRVTVMKEVRSNNTPAAPAAPAQIPAETPAETPAAPAESEKATPSPRSRK